MATRGRQQLPAPSLLRHILTTHTSFPFTGPNVPAPRPASASSIPSLLSAFQSEWDAVMLESLALKTQYQATRQELAHALYREDASIRVVARLLKERDSARE